MKDFDPEEHGATFGHLQGSSSGDEDDEPTEAREHYLTVEYIEPRPWKYHYTKAL